MNSKQLTRILNNEKCFMCGRSDATDKCLSCMIENKLSYYCDRCRYKHEPFHKPVWLGAYE